MFIIENRCHMKRLYSRIILTATHHFIVYTPNDFSFTVQAACRALVPKRQAEERNVSFSTHRMQTLLLSCQLMLRLTVIPTCYRWSLYIGPATLLHKKQSELKYKQKCQISFNNSKASKMGFMHF